MERDLITALARAFRWRKQLEAGAYAAVAERSPPLKDHRHLRQPHPRLTLLAPPDIVEGTLVA